jgi:uncharacterized membrane protein YhaH (DUF805 family)
MSARAKSPAAATRPATKERCGSALGPERSERVHKQIRERRDKKRRAPATLGKFSGVGRTLLGMASDEAQEATPPSIVALADQVDELRGRVQRMHAELRTSGGAGADRHAAVNRIGAATVELIDTQSRLRAMRVAHRQQVVAQQLEQDRRRGRQRLWQLTGLVAFVGALIVVLAVGGAIAAARLAIGIPVLLAGALMAVSMTPRMVRDAGRRGLDLRKALATGVLAVLALVGALAWRPLGYACLLALVVAALPLVAAGRARRRREAAEDGGADVGRKSA